MTQRTSYPEGAPCWADLSTPDLQGALRFYGPLLGWTFDEPVAEMGYYTMARKHGKQVAGLAPQQPDVPMPPMWSVYMWSNNVDDTAARLADAGGKLLMPVMEIPGAGRMMFAFDNQGAPFGAWEPGNHRGSELHAEPGAICWAEINTRDGAGTDMFYKRVFGYPEQTQIGEVGGNFDYTVWKVAGEDVAGRLLMTSPEWPENIPPTGCCTSRSTTSTPPSPASPSSAARSATARSTRPTAASLSSTTRTARPSRSCSSTPKRQADPRGSCTGLRRSAVGPVFRVVRVLDP